MIPPITITQVRVALSTSGHVAVTCVSIQNDVTGNGASCTSTGQNAPLPIPLDARPSWAAVRRSRRCQRCNFIVASGSSHCGNCGKRAR